MSDPAPALSLPVQPPIAPMLAEIAHQLPTGDGWLYEPKWDGFRALVFWDDRELLIQSRDLRPLNRYFPELEAGVRQALPAPCVLDGEVVIAGPKGLDFEALQQRIHPAASRIRLLARETPAEFVAFDLLATNAEDLTARPQAERRQRLEQVLGRPAAPLVDILRQHHARQLERQLLAGQRWQEHHLVFPSTVGTPRRGSNLWLSWQRLLKRLGLPAYKFHELRHTAASLALAEGASLFHVSRMLGHSSISITADTYGHMTDEGREDVAARMGRALFGTAASI